MNVIEQNAREHSRGVITLAFGKERYIEMAKSLGRSLQIHAPLIPRAVVTDSPDAELAGLYTEIIAYQPEFGSNVRQKLHLDRYTPFAETLFIDSDCLVLGNLESFWRAFEGQYFGALGWRALVNGDTDPYLNVAFILRHFALETLPKFNGGVYYLTRSEGTTRFFETARTLLSNFESLHFPQFRRNGPADEAILSVAMALHGLRPTSMGTGGMWTPISSRGQLKLNVLKGLCSFEKEGRNVLPEIVHFPGEYANCFAYYRECARLKRRFNDSRDDPLRIARSYLKSALWRCARSSRNTVKNLLAARQPLKSSSERA